MALKNTTAAEAPHRQHLFERVGKGVPQHKIVAELIADLPPGRGIGFVKTERNIQLLQGRP